MNLTNTRPKTLRKFRRGFTLIEMLLVVAIIGILVSIGVPAMRTAKSDTQNAKTDALRTALNTAMQRAVLNGQIVIDEGWITYDMFKQYVQINGKTAPPILTITDGTLNGTGRNIVWWGYQPDPSWGDPGVSIQFSDDFYSEWFPDRPIPTDISADSY